jgi:hypothetical protein
MELKPVSPTAKAPAERFTGDVYLVVSRDGTVIRIRPGDTVWTRPDEQHWHGATVDCMMSHYALLEGTENGDSTTWLEPVTDEQYEAANQGPAWPCVDDQVTA